MKAIREARLISAFFSDDCARCVIEKPFFNANTSNIKCLFFIHWFFNWDEAKYQYSEKGGDEKCM